VGDAEAFQRRPDDARDVQRDQRALPPAPVAAMAAGPVRVPRPLLIDALHAIGGLPVRQAPAAHTIELAELAGIGRGVDGALEVSQLGDDPIQGLGVCVLRIRVLDTERRAANRVLERQALGGLGGGTAVIPLVLEPPGHP